MHKGTTPHTLRAWFRKLAGSKYDSANRRSTGRPSTKEEIAELAVPMAKENETWGYTRIRDAINNLGHEISRDSATNILKDHGIEPAPERGERTTWTSFLKQHWNVLAATDFFTVEAFTPFGIIRYQVLFVIDLATREVHVAGISEKGKGPWMEPIARNLTDACDGFLKGYRFLIHDRDPLFTQELRAILSVSGVESVRLPRRSPNLNAFAERFVKSIKHECLNRLVIFSEEMLRFVINEYLEHYHSERNHQAIQSKIINPGLQSSENGMPTPNSRLGDSLNAYGSKAA